jgi:large subunit ribosomal protein L22
MGRAFRYQRRMAHLEIALAERNGGSSNLASTVGDAAPAAKRKPAAKAKKAPAKKTAAKKSAAKKKTVSKK